MNVERPFQVVKLHGSINWFATLSSERRDDWYALVDAHDIFARIPERDILIYDSLSQSPNWIPLHNQYGFPLVTAPVAGDAKTPVCPESHIEAAQRFLSDCGKFLVIGWSAMDEDLLDIINGAAQGMPLVHVVDHGNAVKTADRLQEHVQAFKWGNVVDLSKFDEGFGIYINSPDAKRFAQFRVDEGYER